MLALFYTLVAFSIDQWYLLITQISSVYKLLSNTVIDDFIAPVDLTCKFLQQNGPGPPTDDEWVREAIKTMSEQERGILGRQQCD